MVINVKGRRLTAAPCPRAVEEYERAEYVGYNVKVGGLEFVDRGARQYFRGFDRYAQSWTKVSQIRRW